VIVDRFSRWPIAYTLRSLSAKAAKAVCDALLQVSMTFAVPKVIRYDCGSNFTSPLTQEFLKRLGCSPRFNTLGHPEASGLVERCNSSLKTMIYKLAQSDPRGWHRLLPLILWSLREKPSATTHISPYTLVYGTLPKEPLSILRESWAGERELPFSIGKKPEEYMQNLNENLEMAKIYADYYSEIEQRRYAEHYNLRSTDRKFEVGDKVIVLAPDFAGAKLYSRWQGPGTIIEVKSPYSYTVEIAG
jgi:transposase InsO family protein